LALKSTQRDRIRIDGKPGSDLDFQNLGPRLVYAGMGKEAPSGDLYDLTGHLVGYNHDNPQHRKAIKRALASCLKGGAGGKRGTKPKDGKLGTTGILDPLPSGITAAEIRKALVAKHPEFRGILEACGGSQEHAEVPVGFSIMFDESRILLKALEKLMDRGVVALPQHDGLLVARSNQRIAEEALETASMEIVRVKMPAEVKADYGAPGATESLLAA
jgi:hypothetical protein